MSGQKTLRCLRLALTVALACGAHSVRAVDFHAFEFNESAFFFLSETANTGTPGGQSWVESNNLLDSETDGAGNFRISKDGDTSADNYLQIDNITSSTVGSRYIVARMSGWDLYDSVVNAGEGFWLAFLDDDSGTGGSSVTAQVLIDRNTTTEAIELRGSAIGVGSGNIASRATLSTTQTAPFTMVLELNKTSNTYEVFYKDGNNPAQWLGTAPIAPTRNGNSIRMAVRNSFGSTIDEFLAIDRIALTDTNPLTDLVTLQVDRISGEMKLINTTGTALTGLRSYTLTSAAGALNPTNWKSITDFYDQAPGNGSVDPDGAWSKTSTTTSNLSEEVVGGNGGNLSINQEVILSMGSGTWIQGIYEDLEITLNFDGGITRRANVNFVGNGGKRFTVGDLNFDGQFTAADWTAFNAGGEVELDGLSLAQQYEAGDLNSDGTNDIFDFAIFKNAYEIANGLGSFDAMLASIPEPSSVMLITLASMALLGRRRSFRSVAAAGNTSMKTRNLTMLLMFAVTLCGAAPTPAAVLEDFQFDDADGTPLSNVTNNANPTNTWSEDTNSNNSSVQNQLYHIQQTGEDPTSNYLDIANITSGKAWLVAEIAGWNFTPVLGAGEDAEEFRLAFLQNDNLTGSTLTAQFEIERNSTTGAIQLVGNRAGGGSNISNTLTLTHSRATPFTVALEIDEDNNNYTVYYRDNTDPFVTLGTAPHDSARDGNSLRMFINNNFGGAGEFFDIDRIYLTDTDPTNISNDRLTLQVNTATGELKLRNTTPSTFDIDAYTITSATLAGDLNLAGWSSLSDKMPLFDPVDGPDGDSTLGNGVGETWDEAPGSTNKVLAERFLLGSSLFPNGREVSLGNAFKIGGDTGSLSFQYRNADTGAIVSGDLEFISVGSNGDYDNDGDVDGRDFLIWQRGQSPNPLSSGDLVAWQTNYGAGGSLSATQAVPEPVLLGLLLPTAITLAMRRNRRPK